VYTPIALRPTGTANWPTSGTQVVVFLSPQPADQPFDFDAAVTDTVTALVEDLRRLVEARAAGITAVESVVLYIDNPDLHDHEAQAVLEGLFEAARGIAGSLTLELGATGLRVNVVRSRDWANATSTLEFLAAPEASFVAGATLELRELVVPA